MDLADPSGAKPVDGNCGPDNMYCGGLAGGEYDYPLDPQPGDPCYYDIYCYYDGTATAADIAQIDAANAAFIAEGEALSEEINAEQAGNDAAAAAAAATIALIDETACGAIPDCVDNTAPAGLAVAAAHAESPKGSIDRVDGNCGSATLWGSPSPTRPGFVNFAVGLETGGQAIGGIIWAIWWRVAWVNVTTLQHDEFTDNQAIDLPFVGPLYAPDPNREPYWAHAETVYTGAGEIIAAFYFTAFVEEGDNPQFFDVCRNFSTTDAPNVRVTVP